MNTESTMRSPQCHLREHPELSITFVALLETIRASMVGALLANLLVALGFFFLLGEPRRHGQEYNPNAIRIYSSTMVLAWISLALPSAFHSALEAEPHLGVHATLAFAATIVLLGLYGLFLLYSLRTHPEIFAELNAPASQETIGEHPGLAWTL